MAVKKRWLMIVRLLRLLGRHLEDGDKSYFNVYLRELKNSLGMRDGVLTSERGRTIRRRNQ